MKLFLFILLLFLSTKLIFCARIVPLPGDINQNKNEEGEKENQNEDWDEKRKVVFYDEEGRIVNDSGKAKIIRKLI